VIATSSQGYLNAAVGGPTLRVVGAVGVVIGRDRSGATKSLLRDVRRMRSEMGGEPSGDDVSAAVG
jgi:hypothetical protein